MTIRKTVSMDLNPKTSNQIDELIAIANEGNFKISKIGLFRTGLSIIYEQVMNSENKSMELNNLVMQYDK